MTVPLSVILSLRKSESLTVDPVENLERKRDITKHETYENPILSLLFAYFCTTFHTFLLMPVKILIIFFSLYYL